MISVFAAYHVLFQILLAGVAIFLILLVLVQRGRGGGLAGALGGMGGSSAFGAKAGDIFTRITVVAAAVWILLCIAAAKFGPSGGGSRLDVGTPVESSGPLLPAADGSTDAAGNPASELDAAREAASVETPASDAPADSTDEK